MLSRTCSQYALGIRVPWKSSISHLQNEIALLKFLTACVLITLGPVIRKLFTDLKQREESESQRLPQAEEHPCKTPVPPTRTLPCCCVENGAVDPRDGEDEEGASLHGCQEEWGWIPLVSE